MPHFVDHQMEIHKVVVGPYDNNVFVVRCKRTGDAVLLDAANEHEKLLELCQQLGVRRVLETHGHWDHIQAVPAMREAGYEVAVTALDAPRLKDVGYTEGSICFLVEGAPVLFSGDTLFPGGPGNATFEGGDFTTLIGSIDRKLFTLPPDTLVLPGHGTDTTIGTERPHLQEWVDRGW